MRLFVFLGMMLFCVYACDNELTTIGQDLINNSNHISQRDVELTNIGTIMLDSFPTSSGERGVAISEMYVGRYKDDFTGETEAAICFQIAPLSQPNVDQKYFLDSVTFHFAYARKIWGDTIYAEPQTLELYQLGELPELPRTPNNISDYFYNNSPIDWEHATFLSSVTFLPEVTNIRNSYFKITGNWAYWEELFRKMQYKDDIFTPVNNSFYSFYRFLDYFKGLAIKAPDNGANDCIMAFKTTSDSMYMRFHYHEGETQHHVDLSILTSYPVYNYNRIVTKPVEDLEVLTESQKEEVMFEVPNMALIQGLSGYATKIVLPDPEVLPAYTTVIKAEIELKPKVWHEMPLAMPSTISVHATTNLNEDKGLLYNTSSSAVTGNYVQDLHNIEDNRYIFDITDYYLRLQNSPAVEGSEAQILLQLPDMYSSFNRVIIEEKPILHLYFANYRD